MTNSLWPLFGGILIGTSAALLLYFNGRVAGISGILFNCHKKNDGGHWRIFFILGLLLGGLVVKLVGPSFLDYSLNLSYTKAIIAGLFVGAGTHLGSGCTSGHGVCGLSRFSMRSLVATITFMAVAIAVVSLMGLL
ncbi:sulfur transport [Bacteriovorax sp. BAL6_X]|uniref:YeeE/YedE family protein n=1 Tax=Bacteriovorax sp. BAL6_X TaxID=1201290 RepID=UPI0003856EE6|nr:YeeE/YedE thiosulfate transporter family protein [Bacteriovorax sp. BAL6_X]EPZ51054.1 sulfur transport [Bacteriovorax sp. BAL6_X]